MISYLDKMNLRPAEKRLVVFAALALFVVVNLIFVVPSFGEWGRKEQQMRDAQIRLSKYQVEVAKQPTYQRELERLKKIGSAVPSEDQALDMAKTINDQALLSGVSIQSVSASPTQGGSKTNLFFEERTASVTLNATEAQLVDFLYLLGSGDSLIRARSMTVTPDTTRMRLNVNMTLVASYQKKPVVKSAAAAAPAAKGPLAPAASSPFKPPPTYPKTNAPALRMTNSAAKPK